jgi:predicted alpha/beta superfamily hydrolase
MIAKVSLKRSPKLAQIVVRYPAGDGRIVLRAESEWTRDIEPVEAGTDRNDWRFEVPIDAPFVYFKPMLVHGEERRWAVGHNYLALASMATERTVYPYFHEDQRCAECELNEHDDGAGRRHCFRAFYPPGYHENTLKRYPVLYMQDGQNLFFPGEASQGQHWRIAETLRTLDAMNVIDKVIVVGVYPNEREHDYTKPGYEAYGRFLTTVVKPQIDRDYRTLTGPGHTAVMGSSLGGVVSLYLGWQYPEIFGMAAAMSSTFGWRDDLAERIAGERRRPMRIYLDSGWPRDNYEVTRSMHELLRRRGYRDGIDLDYFSFPDAVHNEQHWAMRAHIPFQLFFGGTRSQPS